MSESALYWGVLWGAIGLGFFVYGKKQRAPLPWVCGLLLMVFPYFVSATWAQLLLGAALCAAPFVLRRWT